MKRILHLLIGIFICFIISLNSTKFSYAECYDPNESSNPPADNYSVSELDNSGISSWIEARDAVLEYATTLSCTGVVLMVDVSTGPCSGYFTYRSRALFPPACTYFAGSATTTYHYVPYSCTTDYEDGNCPDIGVTDSDGDDILDKEDLDYIEIKDRSFGVDCLY